MNLIAQNAGTEDFAFSSGRIIIIIESKYEILEEIGYLLCIRKDLISNKNPASISFPGYGMYRGLAGAECLLGGHQSAERTGQAECQGLCRGTSDQFREWKEYHGCPG